MQKRLVSLRSTSSFSLTASLTFLTVTKLIVSEAILPSKLGPMRLKVLGFRGVTLAPRKVLGGRVPGARVPKCCGGKSHSRLPLPRDIAALKHYCFSNEAWSCCTQRALSSFPQVLIEASQTYPGHTRWLMPVDPGLAGKDLGS